MLASTADMASYIPHPATLHTHYQSTPSEEAIRQYSVNFSPYAEFFSRRAVSHNAGKWLEADGNGIPPAPLVWQCNYR